MILFYHHYMIRKQFLVLKRKSRTTKQTFEKWNKLFSQGLAPIAIMAYINWNFIFRIILSGKFKYSGKWSFWTHLLMHISMCILRIHTNQLQKVSQHSCMKQLITCLPHCATWYIIAVQNGFFSMKILRRTPYTIPI